MTTQPSRIAALGILKLLWVSAALVSPMLSNIAAAEGWISDRCSLRIWYGMLALTFPSAWLLGLLNLLLTPTGFSFERWVIFTGIIVTTSYALDLALSLLVLR